MPYLRTQCARPKRPTSPTPTPVQEREQFNLCPALFVARRPVHPTGPFSFPFLVEWLALFNWRGISPSNWVYTAKKLAPFLWSLDFLRRETTPTYETDDVDNKNNTRENDSVRKMSN